MDAAGRTAAGDGMTAADREALEALVFHWGDAYEIEHTEARGWRARRRDGLGGWLTAASPEGLLAGISADYQVKPVPRPGGEGTVRDPDA